MSRAVTIVGGGLAGVLAAFEAHRQGAAVTLCEQADLLGGSARGRMRHGVELRERPILFGPPSDPVAGLLEDYGVPLHAFPDKTAGGPIASLPAGGFPRLFDTSRTRLRVQGVKVETGRLVSPREAVAMAAAGEVVVWAADPTPLFKPLGLGRPALEARTRANYSFCAYWDGPLPFRLDGDGALARIHLYESGGQTVLTAERIGEEDEEVLRAEIARLMGRADGFLKVAGLLGQSIHTRWSLRSSEVAAATAALDDLIAARCPGRFLVADWPSPDADLFLALRAALEAALYEAPLRAAG